MPSDEAIPVGANPSVRIVGIASEHEMVAQFALGEHGSPEFRQGMLPILQQHRIPEHVITRPNLNDPIQNAMRVIAMEYRGLLSREGLFARFPRALWWAHAEISQEGLGNARYIADDCWRELSHGSRHVADGAEALRAGSVPRSEKIEAVAAGLNLGKPLPPLILVGPDLARPEEGLVLLEGHSRATAYLLRPEAVRWPLRVIIGYSPRITDWVWYRTTPFSNPTPQRPQPTTPHAQRNPLPPQPLPQTPQLTPRPDALPDLVLHADWSTDPKKRWFARARQVGGSYRAESPRLVGDAAGFFDRCRADAGPDALILAGFDFPIGVPEAYARRAGIGCFLDLLPILGSDDWSEFYEVARTIEEITHNRPFYPHGSAAGVAHADLFVALGCTSIDQLRRRCDLRHGNRQAACPIFWTLGGNQVGKAAISGWRDVLGPALRRQNPSVKIWPFAGALPELLEAGNLVIVETYPGEFYHHLKVQFPTPTAGLKSGKRVQSDRARQARPLLEWARSNNVSLAPDLDQELRDGFGSRSDGEDRFDAVIGLFGMLNVLFGHRSSGEPATPAVQNIEGWIFGQTELPP